MFQFNPQYFLAGLISIILAITIHEFAHAYAADRSGDNTPRANGRISLNPLDHLDPVGTMMILFTLLAGFGIGWGKPVPVNSQNFRNPRWDDIKVSLWGPLSNLIMAFAIAMVLRYQLIPPGNDWIITLAFRFVLINIVIAMFNLLPIPPLDGSHILANMLPYHQARAYGRFMGQFGIIILILILVSGIGRAIILGPTLVLFRLFLGG